MRSEGPHRAKARAKALADEDRMLAVKSETNEKSTMQQIQGSLTTKRLRRRKRNRTVAILGCAVVLMTALSLMIPAISFTQEAAEEVGVVLDTQADADYQANDSDLESDIESVVDSESDPESEPATDPEPNPETTDPASDDVNENGTNADPSASDGDDVDDNGMTDESSNDAVDESDASDPDPDGNVVEGEFASSVGTVDPDSEDEENPAQFFEAHLKNSKGRIVLTVSVEAPEGAFPAGTFMRIDGVPASAIEGAVDRAVATRTDAKVVELQAVDITFTDAKGYEIEPAKPITVTMTSALIAGEEKPYIVHVDDRGRADVVDALSKRELKSRDLSAGDNQLLFDSDEFSTYVLAVVSLEQTLRASDGNSYTVTVNCPAEAGIPSDATLSVQELLEPGRAWTSYVSRLEEEMGQDMGFARLFDITILDGYGNEIQPAVPVEVNISLNNADELSSNMAVAHFANNNAIEFMYASLSGDTVSFDASGFSVYAVVDGSTGDNARMTLEFYSGGTKIATMYVKNKDKESDEVLETIIYDPGAGEIGEGALFGGWILDKPNYTSADLGDVMTIEDIREWAKNQAITEGDTHRFDAAICKMYTVTYRDYGEEGSTEPGGTLGMDGVLVKASEYGDPTVSVGYMVSMAYTPKDDVHNFEGWTLDTSSVTDVTSQIPDDRIYNNGDPISIRGDISFTVNAPKGNWLVFDENGKGATYNAPQFVKSHETTSDEDLHEMTRNGYTFGGWYDTKEHADAHGANPNVTTGKFEFGGELTGKTTIYASWIPNNTAQYTVVFWTQNLDRTAYEVAGSYVGTGRVGQNIPLNVVDNGDEDYVNGFGENGHYTGFSLVNADRNQQVAITPEGDAVLNLHYDRITYNLKIYLYRQQGNGNNSYSYAQNSNAGKNVWGIASWYNNTNLNNMPTTTYGPILKDTQATDGYYGYYFLLTAYYGEDISSKWPKYSQIIGPENNRNPVSFIMMNGTGLKGNGVNDNGYGSGKDTIKGLITTMDEKILGYTNNSNGNFLIVRFNTYNDWRYHIWYETVDGEDYTGKTTRTYNGKTYYEADVLEVRSSNTDVNQQNPPQYSGYEYAFRMNENWTNGERWRTDNPTRYHINYVYNRLKYEIEYFDGSYVDGNGRLIQNRATHPLHTSDPINHGALIPDACKNYEPALPAGESGYVFEGWYLDEACNTPYEWSTMPIGGIKVYAKWRQVQYRVFLHPNAGTDPSLSWGSDSVDTSFRVAYGGKVSTPTGTRENSGYEFVGWYTDPSMTSEYLYNPDTVLNDETVTTTYDKTQPTELDKWGNPYMNNQGDYTDENGVVLYPSANKDANEDRYWITKELDLYAKWRKIIEGAEGVSVVYTADNGKGIVGSNAPVDETLYPDQAEATAQAACTPPENMKVHFKYWVVQTWDATQQKYVDTDLTVSPGNRFVVSIDNARKEAVPDQAGKYTYTMQLRAEYQAPDEVFPTHIWWFDNYSNTGAARHESSRQDEDISINEAVEIPAAPTREGYVFLGWARVNADTSASQAGAEGNPPTAKVLSDLDEDDLYLKYETDHYTYQGTTVSYVAADEATPYHDMYAVWVKECTVTVKKVVTAGGETTREFTFTPSETLGGQSFTLVHEGTKNFTKVLAGTKVSVTETLLEDYTLQSVTYQKASGGNATTIQNGGEITVGDDIIITFTNKRNAFEVNFEKKDLGNTQLTNAAFILTKKNDSGVYVSYPNGTDCNLTLGTAVVALVPGEYKLTEQSAPAGYLVSVADSYFTVDAAGKVTVTSCGSAVNAQGRTIQLAEATKDATSGVYTVTLRDEPGKALPNTGGTGTAIITLVGIMLVVAAAAIFVGGRRPKIALTGAASRRIGNKGGARR